MMYFLTQIRKVSMILYESRSEEVETRSAAHKGLNKMDTNMTPLKRNTLTHMTVTGTKERLILDIPIKMANIDRKEAHTRSIRSSRRTINTGLQRISTDTEQISKKNTASAATQGSTIVSNHSINGALTISTTVNTGNMKRSITGNKKSILDSSVKSQNVHGKATLHLINRRKKL
jgi:hypothetical protein